MESVPSDTLIEIFSRDRQDLRDTRQIAEESGVETGDLRNIGEILATLMNERDLARQMIGIECLGVVKRRKQSVVDL